MKTASELVLYFKLLSMLDSILASFLLVFPENGKSKVLRLKWINLSSHFSILYTLVTETFELLGDYREVETKGFWKDDVVHVIG